MQNGQQSVYPTGGQILGAQTGEVTNYNLPPNQQGPSQPDWNTQWNQNWNQAYNQGFNRQFGLSSYGGSGPFASAQQQGYGKGLSDYLAKNPTGATTGGNGGGGGNGSNNGGSNDQLTYLRAVRSAGDLNPAQDSALKALEASMNNNAQSAYNAQNQALNTQFDQSAANLNGQLSDLGTQKANSLSELGLAQTDAQNQAQSAKLSAQTNTNNQIDQAGSIANSTQLQNRNVLRALGIGNSSYAADLLSKPINEFGKQRANLQEQLGQRMGQLDDFLNSQAQQHSLAVKSLEDNYSSLVGKIQSDLRFNDRQRNDALTAANAALQDNLGKIQSSMLNYHQQVQSQKQQLQNSLIQMLAYQNPSIAKDYLSQMSLNNPDAFQQQGTNIIGAQPVKKDPLTGLPVSQ